MHVCACVCNVLSSFNWDFFFFILPAFAVRLQPTVGFGLLLFFGTFP